MSNALTVAFAVEAGPGVGLGHLRRTQALAAVLRGRGAAVRFLVDGEADTAGLATDRLAWTRDSGLACAALAESRPEAVVVDSYGATPALIERLRTVTGCVVVIDDLADRDLPAHLVVNGAFHATQLPYRGAPDTRFLLGPEYALLDPVFAVEPPRRPRAPLRRVLVTLGGDTPGARLEATVAAVRRAGPEAAIDVAVGPYSTGAVTAGEGVTVHRGLVSLRALILAADLAVTGGGMTLYECLASETPVVGVCLADNQRANIEGLSRAGVILESQPSLEAAIRRLAGDPAQRRAMGVGGRTLVDGRGAERVADAIVRARLAAGVVRSAR
jgi:UDP-2,4-diacetamido-2,4,6-trideoxy-beta-L-altropyranose hydrolase